MLYLILSDNTIIEVKDGSTIFDIMVDPEKYNEIWNQLTPENLKLVKLVVNPKDEMPIDPKSNLVVDNEISSRIKGIVECHFYLREKNEIELLQDRVEKLMAESNVHDGAIGDLATAVSELAEQGGHV